MKLISFNVNGIRARLHQIKEVINKYTPDIIGLQEIKVQDAQFPIEDISSLGYHAEYFGQKSHYGVALLSKEKPVSVIKGFPNDREDAQRRFILGEYIINNKNVFVSNGYFPQGENRKHPVKFPAKEKFYADLISFLIENNSAEKNFVIMGDMNISPTDSDIGIGEENAKRWLKAGKTSFLPEEREWLKKIFDLGFIDTFRYLYPDEKNLFSWFDYRSFGFNRDPKRGLRIDLILASKPLIAKCKSTLIDYAIRGMEKPSDHCPVIAEFIF